MAERIGNLYISSAQMDVPDKVYKLVPARNKDFVVRNMLDNDLTKVLPFDRPGSTAIWGLGGCGKTQIALDYAYQRHDAINCSIFWIRADSADLFAGSYGDIAKEANLPETLTGDDKLRAVRRWIESQNSWLVVVDNADDLDESRSQYLEHVPKHQACSRDAKGAILWTTRDSGILDFPFGISGGFDVSVMHRADSLLLYRKLLRRTRPLCPEEYALPASVDEETLLDELGDLPLAISQAAAFIRKNGDIRKYVDRLRKSESEAQKLLLRDQKDPYRHARQNSVMKTWIVSLTRLKEEKDIGNNAIQILYTAAFLDNQGMTFELLQYSVGMDVDEDDMQDAVARLVEYSFLQHQDDDQERSRTYSQHKLFSMAMRHHLTSEGSRFTHASHTFSIVLHCFPSEDHGRADQCSLYFPHALKVLSETGCTRFQELADQLLPCLAKSYTFHGRYREAKAAIKQLIDLQDQLPCSSEVRTLEAQSALGWIHILQGEFNEAEKILTTTLDRQKVILDQDHPSIWTTTSNLARAVQKIGQYDRAEALQLAVLEFHKQQDSTVALNTLSAMNNLALTYRYQGRLAEAEATFLDILAELEKMAPKRVFLALGVQNNLALVFRDQGALGKAEELLERTIEESTFHLGDSHPDTITAMNSLFSVNTKQGKYDDAEYIGAKVKRLSQTVLGDKHPLYLSISDELSMLREDQPTRCRAYTSNTGTIVEIQSNIAYISSSSFVSNVGSTTLDFERMIQEHGEKLRGLSLDGK